MSKEFLHYDHYTKMKQTETFPFLQQLTSGFFNMQGRSNFLYLPAYSKTILITLGIHGRIPNYGLDIDCYWTKEMD